MKKVMSFLIVAIAIIGLLAACSNDTEDGTKAEQTTVQVSNSIDDMHTNYKISGKECKEVADTVERGDCFQSVHSKYLSNWSISEDKLQFYYPDTEDYSELTEETVLYYPIDESGEIGEVQKTTYYNQYIEEKSVKAFQNGAEKLQSHWYIFSNMIPPEYRKDMKSIVWTNTNSPGLKIRRDKNNIEDMYLAFDQGIYEYSPFYRTVLLHEFGHVLTLNESQVNVDEELYLSFLSQDQETLEQASTACPTYFFWGCLKEESYLNQYYQAFWKDIITDYEHIESDDDYKEVFMKYEARFFNTYQGLYPVEDIADAFAAFIIFNTDELEGQTEMKYEKVKFFYEYEELVELRTQILENIYDLIVSDEKFTREQRDGSHASIKKRENRPRA